ncbi:MAG: AgmX/PglI C-terminal domain-containing protein [Polyangiales bacterium]
MSGASSLPPLKKKDGKFGLVALLLLLAAGGLWLFLRGDEAEPAPEAEAPPSEVPAREQFVSEIEIPEEEDVDASEPAGRPADTPDAPATGGGPEDWECNGSIDTAQVRSFIKGPASKQVQNCYERGLKGNNLLQGSMDVELTIGASGSVRAVSVGGTLQDRQVHSCVKRVARTWKLPKPTGGCVRINVPFQMTPKL